MMAVTKPIPSIPYFKRFQPLFVFPAQGGHSLQKSIKIGGKLKILQPVESLMVVRQARGNAVVISVQADDFDGVIMPEGFEPDHLRRCRNEVGFVNDMTEKAD
jgi:hypothetical protein